MSNNIIKESNYKYHNADGTLSYTKTRIDFDDNTKTFRFVQPDGTLGLQGLSHLLYNLPNVIKANVVYIVEGEKCADALIKRGYTATTLDSGANSKWRPEFTEWLKGKKVIINPDNDRPGMKYARMIKKNVPWAIIKILPNLKEKEDIYDWLEAGHAMSELDDISETILVNEYTEVSKSNSADDKKTQSEILLNLIKDEDIELFLNENHDPYAEIPINGHKEIWSLDSEQFLLWLQRLFYKESGKTIRQENLKQVIGILYAEAKFGDKPCITLYNRVASSDDSFWYDLTSSKWNAVKINKDGWTIVDNPPKLFSRYRHQAEQTTPNPDGDINKIFSFINMSKYKTLFLCWLVACFVPDIPHPMPIFFGEKGAAKSTTCTLLKKLIDPSVLDNLTLSKDEKTLVVNLKQHYFLPFDNVSSINNETSDTLCRAITGGAVQQRKLFTDAEDYIFTFQRCISINGINNVANRADLLDRSILFELERVSEDDRRDLQEIYSSFEKERPNILGAIFNILSKAMEIYPTIKLNKLPRMADFFRWGYAIAKAMNGQGDKFLQEYKSNHSIQNIEAINADTVAYLLVEFMKFKFEWNGRISELLRVLQDEAVNHGINPKSKNMPQAPNNLSRRIKAVMSNLDAVGITFEFDKRHSDGTHIIIRNDNSISPLPPYEVNPTKILELSYGDKNGDKELHNQSSSTQSPLNNNENGDDGDNGDDYINIKF